MYLSLSQLKQKTLGANVSSCENDSKRVFSLGKKRVFSCLINIQK